MKPNPYDRSNKAAPACEHVPKEVTAMEFESTVPLEEGSVVYAVVIPGKFISRVCMLARRQGILYTG